MFKFLSVMVMFFSVVKLQAAADSGYAEDIEDVSQPAAKDTAAEVCGAEISDYETCMKDNYGSDDYKLDGYLPYILNFQEWDICYQESGCSTDTVETRKTELEPVTLNGIRTVINMESAVLGKLRETIAICAMPFITAEISPYLEQCVSSQLKESNINWTAPKISQSALADFSKYPVYETVQEDFFSSRYYDLEMKIREEQQRQVQYVNDKCGNSTHAANKAKICLARVAHEMVSNNSALIYAAESRLLSFCDGKLECQSRLSKKCSDIRETIPIILTECANNIKWSSIWAKIKDPENFTLGKDYNAPSMFDIVEITGTENFLLIKKEKHPPITEPPVNVVVFPPEELMLLPNGSHPSLAINNETLSDIHRPILIGPIEAAQGNDTSEFPDQSALPKLRLRSKRMQPSCQQIITDCARDKSSGVTKTTDIMALLANKAGANRLSVFPAPACIDNTCLSGYLTELLARPFLRYLEEIVTFTPSYNRLTKWGIVAKPDFDL
uniref:Uncharacterized protein n=1 Tax=Plectus sambesii TaxID=2011161 RepID=A0A914WDX2_9BILA